MVFMRFKFFVSNGFAAAQDELPRMAVREAIVNAVCHRDYESNGAVQVMLFRDRLEIMNPGTLPRGWTAETLLTTHESVARNKVIAKALEKKIKSELAKMMESDNEMCTVVGNKVTLNQGVRGVLAFVLLRHSGQSINDLWGFWVLKTPEKGLKVIVR